MDVIKKIDPKHEILAKSLADKGVKYVMSSWIDIMGRSRAKAAPIAGLPEIMAGFSRYTPRGITGIGEMNPIEEEVTSLPDESTLTIMPWSREYAWMAADMWSDKGKPFELCPRSILKKQTALAEKEGFMCTLGVEPEFYLYRPESLEQGSKRLIPIALSAEVKPSPAYDIETILDTKAFLNEMVDSMHESGYTVYSFGAEGGEGQYEIDFKYAPILEAADKMTFFKLMAQEIAKKHNLRVTFMPKPFANVWGSGAHYNIGLYSSTIAGKSVFRDENKQWTKEALAFAAGIMKHAHAIAAISNPLVNSYKRLVPRLMDGSVSWAPIKIAYGNNNRSCMIRLPENRPAIENRSVDPAGNTYLAGAFMLAAGLEGIRKGYDPGEPLRDIAYDKKEIPRLPRTLLEAIEAFKNDPLTYEVFSQDFVNEYYESKLLEWEQDHLQVSDYDREKHLTQY
jgi:glutamine synthetase